VTGAAIFAAVALIIGGFMLWRRPISYGSCVLFLLLMLSVAGLAMSSLGLPKPLWIEPGMPEKAVVLGYALEEPRSIVLMIAMPGGPKLYRMPWDEQAAAGLHDAAERAKAQHTTLVAALKTGKPGLPGLPSKETPMFYPAPRAALPEKQGE